MSFDFQGGLDPISAAYCVDICMLIDATGSMAPIIKEVKQNAMAFCDKFHEAMEASGKNVDELRIKVIPFRDFKYDGAKSLEESEFFRLPEQNEAFRSYVENIVADGGGDEPENALEAMATAMRSAWTTNGTKRRHVILVFTDASALPLKASDRVSSPYYPQNMPADLAELGDMWEGGQSSAGMPERLASRLVLFAPNVTPWCDMQTWNRIWPNFSKAGQGLSGVDIDFAIELLVNSMKG